MGTLGKPSLEVPYGLLNLKMQEKLGVFADFWKLWSPKFLPRLCGLPRASRPSEAFFLRDRVIVKYEKLLFHCSVIAQKHKMRQGAKMRNRAKCLSDCH